MKSNLLLTTIFTQLIFSYGLIARNYYFEEAGVEIVFPSGWKLEYSIDDEAVLYSYSPDEDFTLLVKIINDDSLENAMEFIESSLSLDYINIDIFEKDSVVINGLRAIKGEGKLWIDDDTENTIRFLLAKLPDSKILYLYGIDYPDIIDSYRRDIEKTIKSIKLKSK